MFSCAYLRLVDSVSKDCTKLLRLTVWSLSHLVENNISFSLDAFKRMSLISRLMGYPVYLN